MKQFSLAGKTLDSVVERARDRVLKHVSSCLRYQDGRVAESYAKLLESHPLSDLQVDDPVFAAKFLSRLPGGSENGWILDAYRTLNDRCGGLKDVGLRLIEACLSEAHAREQFILSLDTSKPRLTNLAEFTITKTSSGRAKTLYDFCPLTRTLEEAYGFEFRNIFGGIVHKATKNAIQSAFGYTPSEIEAAGRVPANSGDICAMALFILHFYTDNIVPYVDHWHYLLENDFEHLRRGGTNYMSVMPSEREPELFAKIRSIYVAECLASANQHRRGEFILFEIDW